MSRTVHSGMQIDQRRSAADRAPRAYMQSGDQLGGSCLAAHGATVVRELKPSLARMLATCRAAVAGLITSSSAISLLDRPLAMRSTISCSRVVSGDGDRCGPGSWRAPPVAASRAGSVQAAWMAGLDPFAP